MRPEGWGHVKRLLAVRLDNIGDVVMLGPALRTLHRALPGCDITLMASPAGTRVAPLLPWVDDVLTHRALWQDIGGAKQPDPAAEFGLVDRIRAGSYDAAAVFTSFSQSPFPPAYVAYLAGIPIRLGQSKEFGGAVLSHPVASPPDSVHQVDRNLHLIAAAGFQPAGPHLELHTDAAAESSVDTLLRERCIDARDGYIVLAPAATCSARSYSPVRFGQALRSVARQSGLPVLVVGQERERDVVRQTCDIVGETAHDLAGKTGLPQLAALIRRASLVVCNNSAPLHIADAFGRPVVVLYGGTELEDQWRPRRSPSMLLRIPTDCSPCHLFDCPYNKECLDIPSESLAAACIELLEKTGGVEAAARSRPTVLAASGKVVR